MADRERPTSFGRLYQIIRTLQRTIEDVMPEFEEQMESLMYVSQRFMLDVALTVWIRSTIIDSDGQSGDQQDPPDPSPELIKTHKDLLSLLQQYESLSKRLSNLPCEEGGNQATVQSAVARSSATFLTKEMLKLQVSSPSPFSRELRAAGRGLRLTRVGTAAVPEAPG